MESAALPDGERPEIILDLSRLLSRILHPTPTGIDRVEMAYARELMRVIPDRLHFAAVHPSGFYGRLPREAVLSFLNDTEKLWRGSEEVSAIQLRRDAMRKLMRLRPRRTLPIDPKIGRVYLQASPHHLDRPNQVRDILHREKARFVCLVHDLIPIEYPEYARPGGADQHKRRMDTLGLYADALIANSAATRESVIQYLAPTQQVPPVAVAHLGTHVGSEGLHVSRISGPYFVCVGTIEPRKNHLLLLNIWRRLVEEKHGDEIIPKLVLIGRRGWENENVLDMLDRCTHLGGHVIEASRLADQDVDGLIRGARALLLPSFAEGYGMPVAEALAVGVPVICSDLPALREAGGAAPEYLDPLDGMAWLSTIRDYATGPSHGQKMQVERLETWSAPTWQNHLEIVLDICSAKTAEMN